MAAEDPATSLQNYQIQLQQVEAALTNSPDDADLLKLKVDLLEVINLTLNLMNSADDDSAGASSSASKSQASNAATSSAKPARVFLEGDSDDDDDDDDETTWHQGDRCLALWQDGQYYEAKIGDVTPDGHCTVTFDSYGNTDVCQLTQLKPLDRKRAADGTDGAPKSKKQILLAQREYKKKKAQKKASRQKQLEEEREKEKSKWQEFNSKAFSKNKKGQVKKSIFASPDNINGRVGVGTCGIGGRPMTEFHQQEKWRRPMTAPPHPFT